MSQLFNNNVDPIRKLSSNIIVRTTTIIKFMSTPFKSEFCSNPDIKWLYINYANNNSILVSPRACLD